MFDNQPVIVRHNQYHPAAQSVFLMPPTYYLLGNRIYILPVSQKMVFAPVLQPVVREEKTGWEMAAEILNSVALGVLIGGALVLTAAVIFELIRPRRNNIPLTNATRRYIRERDEEICFYCGDYAPNGHVDHRVSRANNGGNEPENLTWACVFCNCSKGAMNDTEYIALIESYC